MRNIFKSFAAWFAAVCVKYCNLIAEGIDNRSLRQIIANSTILLIFCGFWGAIALLLLYLMYQLWYVILGGYLIVTLFSEWLKGGDPETVPESPATEVDKLLIQQRANELYDDVLSFVYTIVQVVAGYTPLCSPLSQYDIQYPSSMGNRFYFINELLPVFRFDVTLSASVDQMQLDVIHRELQQQVSKQADRFKFLRAPDAEGHPPIEILDLKNMGGSVVIEVVQTTAASLPLIEASRRARVERQVNQKNNGGCTAYDRDF